MVPTPQSVLAEGIAETATRRARSGRARGGAARSCASTASSTTTSLRARSSEALEPRARHRRRRRRCYIHEDGASVEDARAVRDEVGRHDRAARAAERPLRHRSDVARLCRSVTPPAASWPARSTGTTRRRSSACSHENVRVSELALRPDGRRDEGLRPVHRRRDRRGRRHPRAERARHGRVARPHGARRRGAHRPRRRRCAHRARRRLGQDARHRALAAHARARGRDGREPQGARGAREPQRRQGDLVGEGGDRRRDRELPLLRIRDRDDRRPQQPDRRLAALLLAEGAGRRLRADRAVELPADDGDVEARARARGRLHRRAEAGSADAAHRAARRRARDSRSASRRASSTSSPATGRRPARTSSSIRASTRSRSPARRRRAARSCASAPTRSSG